MTTEEISIRREACYADDIPNKRQLTGKMSGICFVPMLLLFVFLLSCAQGEEYYRFQHIDRGNWFRDSLITFHIDSLALQPESLYAVSIEIYTNHTYPYRDIWMEVTHNFTDTLFRVDTLHYLIADDHGRWLGAGVGGLNQLSLPFLAALPLDTTRHYVVQLRQAMRRDPLPGIERIGIKVAAVEGGRPS